MKHPKEYFDSSSDYTETSCYVVDYLAYMLDINHDAAALLENRLYEKTYRYWGYDMISYLNDVDDILKFASEFVEKL